ncbi:MAG: DUF1800 family protein, partial [Terriglobales bacterium]
MAITAAAVLAWAQQPAARKQPLQQEQKIEQAINRLTWGPEPGDVAAVAKLGLYRWMDLQLHPERIAENPVLTAALAPLDSLRMSPAELIAHYPPQQAVRQMMLGQRPLPADAELRAIVETEIELVRQRQQAKTDGAAA